MTQPDETRWGTNDKPAAPTPAVWGMPSTQLDDWLRIEPDGTITVFSGKVELGTGVRTALAQIVAEELDVSLASIHMVMGDTELTPNEGYTAGSMTIQMGGTALRKAAAEARQAMLERAAEALEASVDDLIVDGGAISVRGVPSRSVAFAQLMGGQLFKRAVSGTAPTKHPEEYRLVGTSAPRTDLLAKFTGAPSFVHDLRLPGMWHGRVVRPPLAGAVLESLDGSAVRDAQVVRLGSFVGVIAEREEQAIRAAERLRATWTALAPQPRMDGMYDDLRHMPATDAVSLQRGDVDAAMSRAARRLSATYHHPYQAHASLGPSCAVATLEDGRLTVWSSTQGVYPLRGALADLMEMPIERVRVIHMEGAGAYGQNGADDVAGDAALLARAAGRPVRVQWSRADEFIGEPKTPAMLIDLAAGLDDEGHIMAWEYAAWSPNHGNRPHGALDFLAGQLLHGKPAPPSARFMGGDRNAPTDYALPNQRVLMHWLPRLPLRTSSMRSLGAAANVFANESFMDELARAANVDPVEFRLRHLEDERSREVVRRVAEESGWGAALPAGEGRGIAFARYENTQAYVATVAEVRVDEETGTVRLRRIVVAHDCGLIVNPDGLRNQIEGNVIQSASRALKEEVRFDESGITSLDWQTYPILTFSEVPEIEIILVNQPDQPSVGGGEPATVTTGAAIANAICAATGIRLREAPFTPERVRAALRARG